jgi:regulatory protein
VLGRFGEVGLVDDAAFARAWVESRHRGRGLGRSALAGELRRKGVAPETIQEAVDLIDPGDEEAAARALVARRLPATRRLAPEARMRRLVGMLARRGHPQGLAVRVVREALAADGTGADPGALWADDDS